MSKWGREARVLKQPALPLWVQPLCRLLLAPLFERGQGQMRLPYQEPEQKELQGQDL